MSLNKRVWFAGVHRMQCGCAGLVMAGAWVVVVRFRCC